MGDARMPPGPRAPSLLQAAVFSLRPLEFLARARERYGDVFTVRAPFIGSVVYVADPDAIKQIFTGDDTVFHAGEANARPLEPVLGRHSVLTLDEDEHMEQRKLLLPPFHGDAVRRYGELMREIAAREVDSWPLGEPFPLRPRMQAVTLEVILRAVFGVTDERQLARLRAAIPRLSEVSNLVVWAPPFRREFGRWSPAARFKRARSAVDRLLYEEIERGRSADESELAERSDVLALLLQARHDDGSPMTSEELRDELMTLLTAGHETTATALSWAFERVLRHPPVLARLRDSLAAGEEDYLDAVVKETLRVRPVISDVARKLTTDVELSGYRLPAQTIVLAGIAPVHMRADVYEDPFEFRPERFLDAKPGNYTWLPFGGGVRRCIGAPFAMFETKTVLRTILERVRLSAPSARDEQARMRHVTIVPAKGAAVRVDERLEPPASERAAEPAAAAAR
jgi:cytochrome P450 family 135